VLTKSKRENGKVTFAHIHDIHPFVNKPPPLVQRPSTVGGLDKRSADNYWRAYKPRKAEGNLLRIFLAFFPRRGGYAIVIRPCAVRN
jgi:hypothetical protein